MKTASCLLALALLVGAPVVAGAQSLWREGASGASLFTDLRARGVNDIVTVVIVEQSSSSRSANTTTSKDSTRTAAVNSFPSIFDSVSRRVVKPLTNSAGIGYDDPSTVLQRSLGLDIKGSASHKGQGTIDRSDRVTGQIAARVVKVLDNGNLVIEGRRAVLVNDETQVITISGVVRPQDVSGSNTVLSSQMADAEIQLVGKGLLADAQRPGILYRILDWLRLF